MYRKLLHAKIHGATVTAANLEYEGSLTLPPELMEAAGILPFESLHVWNVTRGTRLETYAIVGRASSGEICANGAAAHLIFPGDRVIVATYTYLDPQRAVDHQPAVVFVDSQNRVTHRGPEVPGPSRRETVVRMELS